VITEDFGKMMDTPGYDDSQLRFEGTEASELVATSMTSSNFSYVRFVVFESIANDTIKLRQSLALLSLAVGGIYPNSTVVVVSKMDCCQDPTLKSNRLALIRKAMTEQGLTRMVGWQSQNEGLDYLASKAQRGNLKAALGEGKAMDMSKVIHPEKRLTSLAQELCAAAIDRMVRQNPGFDKASFKLAVGDFMDQARTEILKNHRAQHASSDAKRAAIVKTKEVACENGVCGACVLS